MVFNDKRQCTSHSPKLENIPPLTAWETPVPLGFHFLLPVTMLTTINDNWIKRRFDIFYRLISSRELLEQNSDLTISILNALSNLNVIPDLLKEASIICSVIMCQIYFTLHVYSSVIGMFFKN